MNKLELKRLAVKYYEENKVPQELENLLNVLFLQQPKDLYGYMSEYFGAKSNLPTISEEIAKLQFIVDDCPVISSEYLKSVEKNVKDTKNKAKKKETASSENEVSKSVIEEEKLSRFSFEHLCYVIKVILTPALVGACINDQSDIDERLRIAVESISADSFCKDGINCTDEKSAVNNVSTSDLDHSEFRTKYSAEIKQGSFFLSIMSSYASSCLRNQSYYFHTLQEKYSVPVPALNVFNCSLSTPGKLIMFKEIWVLPKRNIKVDQASSMLTSFYRHIEQMLVLKFGISGVLKNLSSGAFTPAFDKPEQLFDLIMTAIKSFGSDDLLQGSFDIILYVSAHEFYDMKQNKYEISAGIFKTKEDLLQMYKTWVELYPIIGFIDPFEVKDCLSYKLMHSIVSDSCYIISSQAFGEKTVKEMSNEHLVDGFLINPEEVSPTLSDTLCLVNLLRDLSGHLVMRDHWFGKQHCSLAVDLSISLGCLFLQVSPTTMISLCRLVSCFFELKRKGCLIEEENYIFKELTAKNDK